MKDKPRKYGHLTEEQDITISRLASEKGILYREAHDLFMDGTLPKKERPLTREALGRKLIDASKGLKLPLYYYK